MKNRLLLIIQLSACSLWLQAQSVAYGDPAVQVEQVKLSECSGKSLENRNEIFSYKWESDKVLRITHKDVWVVSSNSEIEIDVKLSNDSILISEKELPKENVGEGDRCLKDLSYLINMPDYVGIRLNTFAILESGISTIPKQTFLLSEYSYDYQITGKQNYRYQPFIMDGACKWITPINWGSDGTTQFISDQDTLILGRSYKKVFSATCSEPNKWKYDGAIREENKQVFFIGNDGRYSEEIAEKKIYDFNLKIGDKIEVTHHFYSTETYEVAFIDTIQVENIFRRKFYFYFKSKLEEPNEWALDSWLEGIGSEYELTYPFIPLTTSSNIPLAGVWHKDKALYRDSYKCTCDEILPVVAHTTTPDFRLLQNPVKDRLLSISLNEAIFSKLDFYSPDGQLQLTKELDAKETIVEISLAGFRTGNYILVLTRTDGSRESCKVIMP